MPRRPKQGPAHCTGCGLPYAKFSTGLTFTEVRQQFWKATDDPSKWQNKRRSTVLGRWHEIKTGMWNEHVDGCAAASEAA